MSMRKRRKYFNKSYYCVIGFGTAERMISVKLYKHSPQLKRKK